MFLFILHNYNSFFSIFRHFAQNPLLYQMFPLCTLLIYIYITNFLFISTAQKKQRKTHTSCAAYHCIKNQASSFYINSVIGYKVVKIRISRYLGIQVRNRPRLTFNYIAHRYKLAFFVRQSVFNVYFSTPSPKTA